MSQQPGRILSSEFIAHASGSSGALPLIEELAGSLDPWEVCVRLAHLPRLLFLDSGGDDPVLGRYTFISADPLGWLSGRNGRFSPSQQIRNGEQEEWSSPFSRRLALLLERFHVETVPGLPPFQGGLAGLWGYDCCHYIERLPRPLHDEFQAPDAALGVYDWVIGFDRLERRTWLLSTGFDPQRGFVRERAEERLRAVLHLLNGAGPRLDAVPRHPEPVQPLLCHPLPGRDDVWSNFDRSGYLDAARRAIEYTHAGDCFQVNLSQRLLARETEPAFDLYARLRERNPAPFGGFFDLGEFALASASPERFLKVTSGAVQTRPIKGTRPRGATPAEDEAMRRALLDSIKDRAENVMIVDLLRNDLGRVCSYGSVRVEALCRLESYRHVHHLVSEVCGKLRPGQGPVDLLRATFPGGSVTGAPKVRAMEIIAELEPTSRGPYCGCLGYIGFDGSMDSSLLIRTFTIGRGWVQFPVGGGIVADSTPEAEYEETLHKAEGLLRALPR